jgi:hypothetical protein
MHSILTMGGGTVSSCPEHPDHYWVHCDPGSCLGHIRSFHHNARARTFQIKSVLIYTAFDCAVLCAQLKLVIGIDVVSSIVLLMWYHQPSSIIY